MIEIFIKGGPIMWPLLLLSLTAVAVLIERLNFLFQNRGALNSSDVKTILSNLQKGQLVKSIEVGKSSVSPVARVLSYGLEHKDVNLNEAILFSSSVELDKYNKGLSILDTIVTLAPLLGLLGTVTGMISAFGLLGNSELDAPLAMTGGIAEALIATAFGLGIAIVALLILNLLNSRLEKIRYEIELRATQLGLILSNENSPVVEVLKKREAA
jgi:biopolymer transport protein ExbB